MVPMPAPWQESYDDDFDTLRSSAQPKRTDSTRRASIPVKRFKASGLGASRISSCCTIQRVRAKP